MEFNLKPFKAPFSKSRSTSASEQDEKFDVIDVRTPDEFRESHLKGALHLDVMQPDFLQKAEKLDKSKAYKLYCHSGNRAERALEFMKNQGFTKLENLGGLEQASSRLDREYESGEAGESTEK